MPFHFTIIRCAFCSLPYDFIGKIETFTEDLLYVFDHARWKPGEKRPDSNLQTNTTPKKKNRTVQYFSQLGSMDKIELYKMYELDFEMFGYSADMYLD